MSKTTINRREAVKLTGAAVICLAVPSNVQAQDAECVRLYRRFCKAHAVMLARGSVPGEVEDAYNKSRPAYPEALMFRGVQNDVELDANHIHNLYRGEARKVGKAQATEILRYRLALLHRWQESDEYARQKSGLAAAEAEATRVHLAEEDALDALSECHPRTLYGVALKLLAANSACPDTFDSGLDPECGVLASAVRDVQSLVGNVS